MSKIIVFSCMLLIPMLSLGQNLGDFESYDFNPESFLNGSDGISIFESGPIKLYNDYNPDWQSWTGWSISNVTDNTTPGFANQYSSIAGKGAEQSKNYAVTYAPNYVTAISNESNTEFNGLYLSNNTYTYFSMLNGDAFAKKFGGESGDDPDFFFVTIKAFSDGILSADSIDFYFADYRFENNEEDYIIDDWAFIDLQLFGNISSLQFNLNSSDVGSFGMNTPAYFCMDQIYSKLQDGVNDLENRDKKWKVYPSIGSDIIMAENLTSSGMPCTLFQSSGRKMGTYILSPGHQTLDISMLHPGSYVIVDGLGAYVRFIKI